MITYKTETKTKVYLEGKLIGEIRGKDGVFRYYLKGGKCGPSYYTLEACKRSLEEE